MEHHDLTMKQAADHLGKSVSTVRRLASTGVLDVYTNNRGRKMVCSRSLHEHMHEHANELHSGASAQVEAPRHDHELVQMLRDALQHERRRCEKLETQVEALHSEIFKLTQELKAILQDKGDGNWKLPFRWMKG